MAVCSSIGKVSDEERTIKAETQPGGIARRHKAVDHMHGCGLRLAGTGFADAALLFAHDQSGTTLNPFTNDISVTKQAAVVSRESVGELSGLGSRPRMEESDRTHRAKSS
jgi:hypothetical protein